MIIKIGATSCVVTFEDGATIDVNFNDNRTKRDLSVMMKRRLRFKTGD